MSDATASQRKMHVKIAPGDVPRYAIIPGDPSRVPLIGEDWASYEEISFNREFRVARGTIGTTQLAACSTGIGGPSTDIAVQELSACGVDTFIRVGTCAALQEEIACGTLVISSAAVRLSGAADAYVGREYPAAADIAVTYALIEAAEELGATYTVGVTASVDSFFAGQDNPTPQAYRPSHIAHIVDDFRQQRVANIEMEAATLFVLGSLFGLRSGCICAVGSNRITRKREPSEEAIRLACRVASRAIELLAARDARAVELGKARWYPGL
ncbi:nucleoside phosphorylase [Microvirga sp. 2TAF3]|uniref:nucleoside phosphorylase n=1 Tax=Microvirga sp. 2TAF3 TaxID=3233014 RepID=UPI003F9B5CEA